MQTGTQRHERLSDEDLVRRFQNEEDPEGMILELYRRHQTVTLGFFRRRIGDPEIAAEQNQELYLAVVRHLSGFRLKCSFRTWLFQLAHHQLSHLRRRWRVHVDERADELPENLRAELSAGAPGPHEEVGRAQLIRALRRCMAALSEIERAVIYGQYYEEATLEELTREIGLNNKSGARAPLIAAQRKLRRCLEKTGIFGGDVEDALGDAI